jgi:nitrite reductase [NAD(P)H] small subunit
MSIDWQELLPLDDLDESRGRIVDVEGHRVALYRVGDTVVALSDQCPHAGGSLGAGWIEDGEVVCPLHHWRFRLRDGRCSNVSGYGVARWECEVRGGSVWVRT